jgi:hypothetical protein
MQGHGYFDIFGKSAHCVGNAFGAAFFVFHRTVHKIGAAAHKGVREIRSLT